MVLLERFQDSDNEHEGEMVIGSRVNRGDEDFSSDYWPKSWTTGADGRFRIEGIVPEKMVAQLHFRHPDFADDSLVVSTGLPFSDWMRSQAGGSKLYSYARASAAGDRGRHGQGDRATACGRARRDESDANESLSRK